MKFKNNVDKWEYILAMLEKGYTQTEISKMGGISQSTIRKVQNEPEEYRKKIRLQKNRLTVEEFRMEWTKAVNRIRRFCGKEPF